MTTWKPLSCLYLLAVAVWLLATSAPTAAADSTIGEDCVHAGLTLPQVTQAFMTHPGKIPYERGPRQFEPSQTTRFRVIYPALPEQCSGQYLRVGRSTVEIKQPKSRWRNMEIGWHWAWIWRGNDGGSEGAFVSPTGGIGHEPRWWFWTPGAKVRGTLENLVKNATTGKIEAARKQIVPIEVRGHG